MTAEVVAVAVLGAAGLVVSLSGAVGLLRMPDLYTRIQCSTASVTIGAVPVLVAVVVATGPVTRYGSRALAVAFLLLVASPLASHALARAAYRTGVPMWKGAIVDMAEEQSENEGETEGGRR